MKRFTVTTEGQDRLGLVAICQRYVDEQWVADHASAEQAAEILWEQFRRAVMQEFELIEVRCVETDA